MNKKKNKEHTKLDMAKCFSWQKSNNLSLFKQEEKQSKVSSQFGSSWLPFENAEFVKKFAYKDSLDYAYFVKRGRPFFAYFHFMQAQLRKYGKINKIL